MTDTDTDNADVLPLTLDDGTRITCTSISGGADSTDGKPNELTLCFTDPDHGDQTVRYISELVKPTVATDPLPARVFAMLEPLVDAALGAGSLELTEACLYLLAQQGRSIEFSNARSDMLAMSREQQAKSDTADMFKMFERYLSPPGDEPIGNFVVEERAPKKAAAKKTAKSKKAAKVTGKKYR